MVTQYFFIGMSRVGDPARLFERNKLGFCSCVKPSESGTAIYHNMSDVTASKNIVDTSPRITPVEKPKSFKLKLAYWYARCLFGKVITPMKVVQARFPETLGLAKEMVKAQNNMRLPNRLKYLIKVYVATINGCAFCVDIGRAFAKNHDLPSRIFDDLLNYENSGQFTDAEKAALAYVEEATRNKHIGDETFNRLRSHFDEAEIICITTLNAIENYYNLVNAPLQIPSDELCKTLSK